MVESISTSIKVVVGPENTSTPHIESCDYQRKSCQYLMPSTSGAGFIECPCKLWGDRCLHFSTKFPTCNIRIINEQLFCFIHRLSSGEFHFWTSRSSHKDGSLWAKFHPHEKFCFNSQLYVWIWIYTLEGTLINIWYKTKYSDLFRILM